MKSKKILVAIIIIALILILSVGAFAYIYLYTDLLKTNKQLFGKYAGELVETVNNFLDDENIKNYYERKINGVYENEGKININEKKLNDTVLYNVDFIVKGATDNINKNLMQNISINYSKDNSLLVDFVRNNDEYGIISNEIINKYLTVKTSDIEEVLNKMNLRYDYGNLLVTIINSKISFDDFKTLKNKYYNLIVNNLEDADFSKEDGVQTAYVLTINNEKFKFIMKNVLEELKNETIIINKIKSEEEKSNYQKSIDSYLKKINNENNNIKIKAYTSTDQILNLSIEINNTYLIAINHSNSSDLRITIKDNEIAEEQNDESNAKDIVVITLNKEKNSAVGFVAEITGLKNFASISAIFENIDENTSSETYKLTINNEERKIEVQYDNKINFKEQVEVTKLDNTNSVNLNSYSKEQLGSIIPQIVQQIILVNNEKMAKATKILEGGTSLFNSEFEAYVGDNVSGESAKDIIDKIISHNMTNSERQININGYISQENLQALKELISTQGVYIISVEYDNDGYVNKVVIAQ